MDASPINFGNAAPLGGTLTGAGRPGFGSGAASAMSMRWSALHDAAGAVALLAGAEPEVMRPELRHFPAAIRDVGGWRRDLAERGIEDLAAIMEPGLASLLAVHARGADAAPAANALLQEFRQARDAVLALAQTSAGNGHRRFA